MKNLDVKKLAVFIAIIVIVIGGIFLVKGIKKSEKLNKEETEEVEDLTLNYFINLTQGYSTSYGGLDVLYSKEKTTANDIEYGALVNTAIKYAQEHNIDLNVTKGIYDGIEKKGTYGSLSNSILYNGEKLRDTINKLFGEVEAPLNLTGSINYLYDFYYDSETDVYIMRKNSEIVDYNEANYYMDYTVIESKKEKNTYKTTIAVAYVVNNNGIVTYYKDLNNENEIIKNASEFPTDNTEEFDQFTITIKKDDNNNYIFDNIEKIN